MLSLQELRSSTVKELLAELDKARKEEQKTRISIRTKNEKDTASKGKKRFYIAQILTVLKEIELEEEIKNSDKID